MTHPERRLAKEKASHISTAALLERIDTNDRRHKRTLYILAALALVTVVGLVLYMGYRLDQNQERILAAEREQTAILTGNQTDIKNQGLGVLCLIEALVENRDETAVSCEAKVNSGQFTVGSFNTSQFNRNNSGGNTSQNAGNNGNNGSNGGNGNDGGDGGGQGLVPTVVNGAVDTVNMIGNFVRGLF